jgi:surface antigen
MSNLSRPKLGKFLATIAALSSVTAILVTANQAEAVPLYPNDLVNNQVVRLQMEKSAPNGYPVTINITPAYGFKNDGLVNTWIGPADNDSLFKYLTNGSGINFQRVNSGYSLSSKDLNVVQGNTIVSYGSGFGRWQDWNLEKIGGQYGDTYLFHWRTDINTNLCLDIRGFTQGQQLNNRTPVLWNCDKNNVNQRIRVIKQGVPPSSDSILPSTILQAGINTKSKNQCFSLNPQPDGNLALYRTSNGQPIWDSKTYNRNVKQTIFQADGNLVMYNTSNSPVWASGTDRRGARLTVQDDGNMVIYNSQNQAVWATNTVGSCNAIVTPPETTPPQRDSKRKINDFVNQWNGKTGITRYDLGGSGYNGQCVTLVARYLQDHYGASKTGLVIGNGGQTARTVGTNFSSFIWDTNDDPMPGSIISFPSLGYGYGHVALVVSVQRNGTNLNVQILDSNGDNAGPNSVVRLRNITVDTRYWTAGVYGSILYSNPRD